MLEDSFWEQIESGTAKPDILEAAIQSAGPTRTPELNPSNWVESLDTPAK